MRTIKELYDEMVRLPNCIVHPPLGSPVGHLSQTHLPVDLRRFYSLCGGVELFVDKDYPVYVVPPHDFVEANPVILGDSFPDDISSAWYIVCHDGSGEYLTIDLGMKRHGHCYDSYSDRHGVVGETHVIARSFTELLNRLVENKGEHWYWLREDFASLGDAYDEI